jgi:hypothetical protein
MNKRQTSGQAAKRTWFKPGPRKGPSPLTIRQQRKRQAAMIGDMLSKMYEQQRLGAVIDPTDVTRLVHTHMLLLREL